ncbi:hypothetical protein Tco_0530185 [Tanacetum coccineum]
MGAFAKHPHSDSNEVRLVTRKYRYTNGEVQSQIDLFTTFVLTLKRTSLDPLWSDLELHLCGDEFLRKASDEYLRSMEVAMQGGRVLRGFSYNGVTRRLQEDLVTKVGDGGACYVLGWLLGDMVEIKFSYEELEHNVKKYWMMAETGNPQFAIACSEVASAFGSFLILISYCWYFCKLLIRLKKEVNVSNSNVRSKMKGYAIYVLQIEDEAKLSEKISRNALKSINQLLSKSEKNEPGNLIKLLKKSTGFIGVLEFDKDQVPPLHSEETKNSWSLVVVTLTAIVVALPNIANDHDEGLIASMKEGLQIVRIIEAYKMRKLHLCILESELEIEASLSEREVGDGAIG